jgi:thiol-disulfide isomerase/thioredoxin
MKRRTAPLALLGAIIVLATVLIWLLPSSTPSGETQFVLLDGRTLTLAGLRGRPVLVSFWAPSCAPCLEELPDLIRLYQKWQPRGLELIAVAMPYDPPSLVQQFVQQRGLPYPVALDLDGKVSSAFGGVPVVPAAFLLAPGGRIALQYTGRLDLAKAERVLARYLGEPR